VKGLYAAFAEEQKMATELDLIADAELQSDGTPTPPPVAGAA
jgi:hypothetical protein